MILARTPLAATLVGLALTLAALGGCTSKAEESTALGGSSFDLFLNDQLGFVDYARHWIRNECLAEAGYPDARSLSPAKDAIPFASLRVRASMFGFISEADARSRGLGRDLPAQPGQPVGEDQSFNDHASRCGELAWSKLGEEARETVRAYYDLGNALLSYRDEVNRALQADLTVKFLDCLQNDGYPVDDREAYLKAPNHQAFGVPLGNHGGAPAPTSSEAVGQPRAGMHIEPPKPGREYIPTPQEADLAAATYRCHRDLSVVEVSMAAAEEAQKRLVSEHESTFLELNPKIEALAIRAAGLVSE